MNIFYVAGNFAIDDSVNLDETELHHAIHVMRCKEKDRLTLINGAGWRYEAEVISIHKKNMELKIIASEFYPRANREIELAVAPPKSSERLDWMVEKLTEIGVTSIVFLETVRTERSRINTDRIQKILIASIKQCKRYWLPPVQYLSFTAYLNQCEAQRKYILSLNSHQTVNWLQEATATSYSILIGPEGDFTPDEDAAALTAGYEHIYLGSSVLRTETAALYISSAVKALHGSEA